MDFHIRKIVTLVEETRSESGRLAERPLRKVAVAAVVKNPYSGTFHEDLSEGVQKGAGLGELLAREALTALRDAPESYGKGGIVGINGEMDHAHMFITTAFADKLRSATGGGKSWIPSAAKQGVPGTALDVPIAFKDALFVRSHYDSIEVRIQDAPGPDEIVVVLALANRGRLNFRLGGLRKEDAKCIDGLR